LDDYEPSDPEVLVHLKDDCTKIKIKENWKAMIPNPQCKADEQAVQNISKKYHKDDIELITCKTFQRNITRMILSSLRAFLQDYQMRAFQSRLWFETVELAIWILRGFRTNSLKHYGRNCTGKNNKE
jgi:hypothetical protein